MTRINSVGSKGPAGAASKAKRTGGAFKAAPSTGTGETQRADAATAAPTLSALIALQAENHTDANRGSKKTIAAAQQVLGELERLQYAMLDGGRPTSAIDDLEKAASLRAHAGADPKLINLYDEIALRARVELAKRGR